MKIALILLIFLIGCDIDNTDKAEEAINPNELLAVIEQISGHWVDIVYYEGYIDENAIWPLERWFLPADYYSDIVGMTSYIGRPIAPMTWRGTGMPFLLYTLVMEGTELRIDIETPAKRYGEVVIYDVDLRDFANHRIIIADEDTLIYQIGDETYTLVRFDAYRNNKRYQIYEIDNGIRLRYSTHFPSEALDVKVYRSEVAGERGERIFAQDGFIGFEDTLLFEFIDTSPPVGKSLYYSIWASTEHGEHVASFSHWSDCTCEATAYPDFCESKIWQMEFSLSKKLPLNETA